MKKKTICGLALALALVVTVVRLWAAFGFLMRLLLALLGSRRLPTLATCALLKVARVTRWWFLTSMRKTAT